MDWDEEDYSLCRCPARTEAPPPGWEPEPDPEPESEHDSEDASASAARKKLSVIVEEEDEYEEDFSRYETSDSSNIDAEKHADELAGKDFLVKSAHDIVTTVLHVEDFPSQNTLTFRVWFIGIGLGMFGAIIQTLYFFRPRALDTSNIFLALIAYVLGLFMEKCLPRTGFIGRWLNPYPFSMKEHAAIVVIASSSAQVALAVQVLAVQRLFYEDAPSPFLAILIVFSSQFLGYGFAGLFRRALVYPTQMLWPVLLPMNSMLESLHRDRKTTKPQRRILWWVFAGIFVWQMFPQYVMPIMTGVSIFCLANQRSPVFTTIFGGTNRNEGLGLLSLGLDWQFITSQPLWYPLQTLANNFVGYLICVVLFAGVYYNNAWRTRDFPFLSQLVFSEDSSSSSYVVYNQSDMLGTQTEPGESGSPGLPYFAGTYATFLFTNNLAVTATIIHLILWNWEDVKTGYAFLAPENLRRLLHPRSWSLKFWKNDEKANSPDEKETDPHYQLMRTYKGSPNWWFIVILLVSTLLGLICIYAADTTLPWFSFLLSIFLGATFILFFGAQAALTGFQVNTQPLFQMIGGYMHPDRPIASLYFTLFGHSTTTQGISLIQNLKFGQYAKLPPRTTFLAQLTGTLIGAVVNYIMMTEITDDQRAILRSPQGSTVWSGHKLQQLNSQAIAWTTLAASSHRYLPIPLALLAGLLFPLPTYILHRFLPSTTTPRLRALLAAINTPLILAWTGVLGDGSRVSSSMLVYFVLGFTSQFALRRYRPDVFVEKNYLVAAALDGGAQALAFFVTVAFRGGVGSELRFPRYWGNNAGGNWDRCARDPAGAGLVGVGG